MTRLKTIAALKKGDSGIIVGYHSEEIHLKLYELGFLPGVVLKITQKLPFNGPITVKMKGKPDAIALRRSEADLIFVEPTLPA